MPNIGVYVSDELEGRIRRLRGKGVTLNVSSVCQEALSRQATLLEEAPASGRKDRLIERLRIAKTGSEWAYQAGRRVGSAWAEDEGAWGDIKAVAGWDDIEYVLRETLDGVDAGVAADGVLISRLDISGLPDPGDPHIIPEFTARPTAQQESFWLGFRDGVRLIRDLVASDMDVEELAEPDSGRHDGTVSPGPS